MKMKNLEPMLDTIEDYNDQESKEKRMTVWIVILSGLIVGVVYGIINANSSVSDDLGVSHATGIYKY